MAQATGPAPGSYGAVATRRRSSWLPWAVVAGLLVLAAAGYGVSRYPWGLSEAPAALPDPGETEPAAASLELELKTSEAAQSAETIARLEREVRQLLEENTTLRSQVEVLRLKDDSNAALVAAQARAEDCLYQLSAVGDQVENLQAKQAQARLIQALAGGSSSGSGSRSSSRRAEPRDYAVFVRQPDAVVHEDGSVDVTGTVHNANDQPIEGFVRVTLSTGGEEVDFVSLHMQVAANSVESYDTRFPVAVLRGNVRVSVAWDKER